MTGLPTDLQKLPPPALDVIRFLGTRKDGATTDEIMAGTGLSARSLGKAIRRLVTRYYVEMPEQEYYTLTSSGQEAAHVLHAQDGDAADTAPQQPTAPVPQQEPAHQPDAGPDAAAIAWHQRRVSAFLPKEMVARAPVPVRVGFEAAAGGAHPLHEPAHVIVRVSVPGGTVEPVERPLELPVSAPAGPVRFRVTMQHTGAARVRVEVFQVVGPGEVLAVGGMFFDLPVSAFPTPNSAEFQALAATVRLHPGGSA